MTVFRLALRSVRFRASAVVAVPGGFLTGWGWLKMLISAPGVSGGISYRSGPAAIAVGLGITVIASVVAAALPARRTARMPVVECIVEASTANARMSRKR